MPVSGPSAVRPVAALEHGPLAAEQAAPGQAKGLGFRVPSFAGIAERSAVELSGSLGSSRGGWRR